MKLAILAAAAAFAVLPAGAYAESGQFGAMNGGAEDWTGSYTIGVDISHVGWSHEAAEAFVQTLAPDTQQAVVRGCEHALTNQNSYHPDVLMFCRNLTGG